MIRTSPTVAAASILAGATMLLTACSSTTTGLPGGTGLPTTSTSSTEAGTTTVTTTTTRCALPLTHATDAGFHIAVPSGWDLSTLNSQVVVGSSATDTEAVLVHPALLTNGLTATKFFNTYLSALDQQNASAGEPITMHPVSGAGGLPAISFTQTLSGTKIEGFATVEVLPLAAPGATQEAAFVSYWAPVSAFSGAANQLASIAACYGPEASSPSRIVRDQVFTYAAPPGWSKESEDSNSLDLHGPAGSDVSYVLAGPVPTSEFDSPQSMIDWFLHGVGITGVSTLTAGTTQPQQTASGATDSAEYEQFTGTFGGTAQRGLVYADNLTGGGVSSGYIRLAVAPVAAWNSINGSLVQIAGSIQHDFTQDLQQLQQVNRQWQNFNRQEEDFDDVLNQQQLVQDPATGIFYEAPYSAYQNNGSRGPGYYLPNGEPLNVSQ